MFGPRICAWSPGFSHSSLNPIKLTSLVIPTGNFCYQISAGQSNASDIVVSCKYNGMCQHLSRLLRGVWENPLVVTAAAAAAAKAHGLAEPAVIAATEIAANLKALRADPKAGMSNRVDPVELDVVINELIDFRNVLDETTRQAVAHLQQHAPRKQYNETAMVKAARDAIRRIQEVNAQMDSSSSTGFSAFEKAYKQYVASQPATAVVGLPDSKELYKKDSGVTMDNFKQELDMFKGLQDFVSMATEVLSLWYTISTRDRDWANALPGKDANLHREVLARKPFHEYVPTSATAFEKAANAEPRKILREIVERYLSKIGVDKLDFAQESEKLHKLCPTIQNYERVLTSQADSKVANISRTTTQSMVEALAICKQLFELRKKSTPGHCILDAADAKTEGENAVGEGGFIIKVCTKLAEQGYYVAVVDMALAAVTLLPWSRSEGGGVRVGLAGSHPSLTEETANEVLITSYISSIAGCSCFLGDGTPGGGICASLSPSPSPHSKPVGKTR